MNFSEKINDYEKNVNKYIYIAKDGDIPIIFTAVHTVEQRKETGIKVAESYTSAICQYVGDVIKSHYLIKNVDNGVDSNSLCEDEFKQLLLRRIKENNIRLLIDIHGAKRERDFDVELGTLSGMSTDLVTQKTLIDCFRNNGVTNIAINDPFKGGGITRYIYENTDIDIIQLEINHAFRDRNNIDECKKICDSLIEFSKIYSNFVNIIE